MNRLTHKIQNFKLRKNRVRSTISGTPERPRLAVYISNRHVTAQVIDDTKHTTLAYATSAGKKAASKGTLSEQAALVGEEIAQKSKSAKVKKVVFDRGGKLYHGRIAALAEAARKNGLEF